MAAEPGIVPGKVTEHEIEWTDEQVSRLWDYYSRACPVPYFSELYGGEILKQSGLPLDAALRVLDFGCGPGFLWDHLQRRGSNWAYTGVDFSADSVAKLRLKAEGNPRFAGAHEIETLPTPLADAQFDVVMILEVVEHLRDDYLDGTLREAARLLKKGGCLVVSTPNDEDLSQAIKFCPECGARFHEWQHVRSWTSDSLIRCLAGYGFEPRRIRKLNFGARGILRYAYHRLRRAVRSEPEPHMLVVFQKT
jgi:SAM-dependent methyltransferase